MELELILLEEKVVESKETLKNDAIEADDLLGEIFSSFCIGK